MKRGLLFLFAMMWLFKIEVNAQLIITDGSHWKVTNQLPPPAGWQLPGFNTSAWANAISPPPIPPTAIPSTTTPGMWLDSNDFYLYFVYSFNLNCLPNNATITMAVDDSYYLFVNGDTIGIDTLAPLVTYNVTANLNVGMNTIAIDALNWYPGAAAVFFTMEIDTIVNGLKAQFPSDTTICVGDTVFVDIQDFDNYLWDNNSTTSNRFFTDTGTYWVEVDTNSCVFSDTFRLDYHPIQSLNLPADTSICVGDSLAIGQIGFVNYLWSTTDTTAFLNLNNAGIYSLTATDVNNCVYTDTSIFTLDTIPQIGFADSLLYCFGLPTPLLISGNYSQINWSNGSNASSIVPIQTNTYWVSLIDSNACFNSDTFFVEVSQGPSISNRDTVFLCPGDSVFIDASDSLNHQYLWSTSDTTSGIWVFPNTQYWVEVSNDCGTLTDTFFVEERGFRSLNASPDTFVCALDSVRIGVRGAIFDSVVWNTGERTDSIWASANQQYIVIGYSACVNDTDSVFITADTPPSISLGGDTVICNVDSLVLIPLKDSGSSLLWNNTFSTDTFVVRGNGQVWVEVSNLCGQGRDTIEVSFQQTPQININDTALCQWDSVGLNAFFPNSSYNWSTGDTTASIVVLGNQQRTLFVTVSNACGNFIEVATVNSIPNPQIQMPSNDIICDNQPIFISISIPFASNYQWSTGSTNNFINITSGGVYSVTATNPCGQDIGSITVVDKQTPSINLPPLTTICENEDETFNFVNNNSSHTWNGMSSTGIEIVSDSGTYLAVVNNECGTTSQIIEVDVLQKPLAFLGKDTTICENQPLTLAPAYAPLSAVRWANGSTDAALVVDKPGIFVVNVTNQCGFSTASIRVGLKPRPKVDIGNDTLICGKQTHKLSLKADFIKSFVWNTGETTNSITVNDSGKYWVNVIDQCDNQFGDSAFIDFKRQEDPFMPNAFTPNDDLLNDGIKPVFSHPTDYRFSVYNRWGNLLFQTTNDQAWSGKLNNQAVEPGIYNAFIEYKNCFGKQVQFKSSIMLLK